MNDLTGVVGRILAGHVGSGWVVRRGEILQQIQQLPAYRQATDRMVRGAIEGLRESGWLICSLGDDNGYFLAGSPEEYQEFRQSYVSYATTILSRAKEMDRTAFNRWGAGALQTKMF